MSNFISRSLGEYARQYEIPLTPEMLEKFEIYSEMLLEWSGKMNLTAITEPQEIAVKHFLDSLLLLKAVELPQNASLIDVGTGAGFPGIPLKIARPDLRVTLLDSLNKRTVFLTEVSNALNQSNSIIHGRAEQSGRSPELREQFDFATARGLAALPALCEYCMPFVKPGGCFAALKGPGIHAEAENAANAISELGGVLFEIKSYKLPLDNNRTIVLVKKISHISAKYPRMSVKIAKKPL